LVPDRFGHRRLLILMVSLAVLVLGEILNLRSPLTPSLSPSGRGSR
jgi:hypothetical protein